MQPELKDSYKGFKLGESHFLQPESIENGVWSFCPERASKEFAIFHLFSKAYKKTDTTFLNQMLIDISEALQNYNIDDVTNLNVGDFGIYVQDGDYVQSVIYNPMTKKINIFMNRKCLGHIKSCQNTINILKHLKAAYIHEGTRKKQDTTSNKDCINQRIELDTYARQYGFELRALYPNESTKDIFKRIFDANIDDEELKNSLIAMFDIMTDKNKNFFLRNLYDYINGEEDQSNLEGF